MSTLACLRSYPRKPEVSAAASRKPSTLAPAALLMVIKDTTPRPLDREVTFPSVGAPSPVSRGGIQSHIHQGVRPT